MFILPEVTASMKKVIANVVSTDDAPFAHPVSLCSVYRLLHFSLMLKVASMRGPRRLHGQPL